MSMPVTERSLLQAALDAQSANDLRRANDLFQQHLMHARDDAVGLAHYGMFCLHTGQYDAACYNLAKATHLLPGDAELLTQFGYAQLHNRDADAAYRAFTAALELAPSDPLALTAPVA